MIAALYIDPRGLYPKMPGVDCWDEARDARAYAGPGPVVAHPPCGPWGALKHMRVPNRARRTADADCMGPAVAAVRRWGGVLEQPARSAAFAAFGMPAPGTPADECGGYTIEVAQSEWGHVARKRTWLYLVGVPRAALEAPPFPGREPTHWVSGGHGSTGPWKGTTAPAHIKICSAQQRRRTPPEFAAYLVRLAQSVRK